MPLRAFKPGIQTRVFCLLSDERAFQSRSPSMFTAVLKRMGIRGAYVPFMVAPENLAGAIESLRVLNIAGANVTVPYKEAVKPYLDELSEGANIIGAVNTITSDGVTLKGYNTNAIGFMDALESAGYDPAGKAALVFGTGGAARAMVFICNWLRAASVSIAGRNAAKMREMADRLGGEPTALEELAQHPHPANLVVNATSVSSDYEAPEMAALVRGLQLPQCEIILDLNYGRRQSYWRDLADARGIRFLDGLSPLAHQAARTFALWTGVQVEPAEFLRAMDVC
jgi:shikimate dehydrogenase